MYVSNTTSQSSPIYLILPHATLYPDCYNLKNFIYVLGTLELII